MRVTIERQIDQWRRITKRATVERTTPLYLVLNVEGQRAYFDRSTAKGFKGAPGNPRVAEVRAGDWSGWTLRWADWDRWWVAGPKE